MMLGKLVEQEPRPYARKDPCVAVLMTTPGVGELFGPTLASEMGDVARFASARQLIGYSGL
jgi:transposase